MKKNYSIFLILCFLMPIAAFAQTKIIVEEVIKEMSKGVQTGFELTIPEVTTREIKSHLNRYLRKDSKSRPYEANGEIYIIGAVNKNISPDLFNVYVKILEAEDGVRLTAFFTENDTLYFSKALSNEQSIAIKKYLKDFAIAEYKQVVKSELESQKRKQKALESQLEELIRAKQRSERNINEAKRTIENNKKEIELNNRLDTAKAEEVLRQKQMVSSLKGTGGEEEKMAVKNLKTREHEKRKLEKEKESLEREIDKMNNRIENEQRAIETSLKNQENKKEEIEKQKNKVKAVENKLDNIL